MNDRHRERSVAIQMNPRCAELLDSHTALAVKNGIGK
jgi:hypothetical protein